MERINYNQRAQILAPQLIGKVIEYNGVKYMITVTEAYPYNDDNSYVKRSEKGKGHDLLTGEDKIGNLFVYAGMLHIACDGGNGNWENEYSCDNVLIRGAIKVVDGIFDCDTDKKLYYKQGKPYTLCKTKLGIMDNDLCIKPGSNNTDVRLYDFNKKYSYNSEDTERSEIKDAQRVNIKEDTGIKLRFYLSESMFEEQKK